MPLFVTTQTTNQPHGVYAVSVPAPAMIAATGTGNSIIVGQAVWGPANVETNPGSLNQFWQTFEPAGMPRTGSFHLSTIRKGWPQLGAVRVADPAAVAATANIQTAGLVTVCTFTASSTGTAGNSITLTVAAASDGVSSHFNLTVAVSSASGTTTETYVNLNTAASGTYVLPGNSGGAGGPALVAQSLIGTIVYVAAGNPAVGVTTATGGTNGTVTSSMYVGTPGSGGTSGFALLENDNTIDFVLTDDPGSSFRSVVNSGLNAHGILMTDRVCVLAGNSGQSAASAQTDAANYRSNNSVYVDPWAMIYDDTTGALQNVPGSSWFASVAAQLPPSVNPAWKAQFVTAMMAGIVQVEQNRGASRAQNTAAGIATLINGAKGGTVFEAGVCTSLTAGQTDITRTRMGIYIARSATTSWYPYVDAPNIPFFQQDLLNSLQNFLGQLVTNKNLNPAVLPYIVGFSILPPSSTNTASSIAAGQYNVGAQVQTGSNMSQIFLSMQYGPTVTVQAA